MGVYKDKHVFVDAFFRHISLPAPLGKGWSLNQTLLEIISLYFIEGHNASCRFESLAFCAK